MQVGPDIFDFTIAKAGEDLRTHQYAPVVLNSSGKIIRPNVDLAYGLRPAGFLMNKPNLDEPARVRLLGIVAVTVEVITNRSIKKGYPAVAYYNSPTVRMAGGRVDLEDLSHATAPVLDNPAVPGSIVMTDDAGSDLTFTAYNAITRTATTVAGDTGADKVSYDIDAPVWGFFMEDAAADGDIVPLFVNLINQYAQVADHLV